MDLATIGGLVVALGMIVVGAALEHVTLKSMLGPSAFLIVIGGSIGATITSHTMAELKHVPEALRMAFKPPKVDYHVMIDLLAELAEKARKNGLLSLQEDAAKADHPLIQCGLTMAVDGSDPEVVMEQLEAMGRMEAEEIEHAAAMFDTAGGYAPTIGILGTVMGLVTVMGNLSEPDSLGPAIAVAFLATLYGVGFANLIFLPLGAKVKAAIREQNKFNEIVTHGIVGLQTGENPRVLREKLLIYAGSKASRAAKGGS